MLTIIKSYIYREYIMKKIALYFGVLFIFFSSQANAIPYEEVIVNISDKSKHIYELKTVSDLKQGRASIGYVFYPKNSTDKSVLVFGGIYDGESGGCYRHKKLGIEKAVTRQKYVVKDLNNDGSNDIGLYFTEAFCDTGKHIYYKKLLLAKKNGFELKEKIIKE